MSLRRVDQRGRKPLHSNGRASFGKREGKSKKGKGWHMLHEKGREVRKAV